MPLTLQIKERGLLRSERVKCCDFHSKEPWLLVALYSGFLAIYNYETQQLVKSIEVSNFPLRAARFVPRKQWIVCGADDGGVRVYHYSTSKKVAEFNAHTDYVRAIAVHPSEPYVLTASDDLTIKLWNWEQKWQCQRVFEGHRHYVMSVEFNPRDGTTFASGGLDNTIRFWGIGTSIPHFTLEGHERGVNCVSFARGGDRPYIASSSDDRTVRIWDYSTKKCIRVLGGHNDNVSAVVFHPQLPLVISGGEDSEVRIWHSTTYDLVESKSYEAGRVWGLAVLSGSRKVAVGCDDGTVLMQLGDEAPVVSLDKKSGKVVWARNQDVKMCTLKKVDQKELSDGERVPVTVRELGQVDIYPQSLNHNAGGRLISVTGEGEYVVYTALKLKNHKFGSGLDLVWSRESALYAVRESATTVTINKKVKAHRQIITDFKMDGIFGGALLAVSGDGCVEFYDWEEARHISTIEVEAKNVLWSDSGDVCVIVTDEQFHMLVYDSDVVRKFFDSGVEIPEEGVVDAFTLETTENTSVTSGVFAGDCFIYINEAGKLNYYVGDQVLTLAHLSRPMYLLGYILRDNRVYLMDKSYQIYSYSLLFSVLAYQTAIVREEYDLADQLLIDVPETAMPELARFLAGLGTERCLRLALKVSCDDVHRFELALKLKEFDIARAILLSQYAAQLREQDEVAAASVDSGDPLDGGGEHKRPLQAYEDIEQLPLERHSGSEKKWKQLGDAVLAVKCDVKFVEECYIRGGDYGGLLLIYSSLSDAKGIERLARYALEGGRNNIAFLCYFLLHKVDQCIALLCEIGRIPEAAFFARTYAPSRISAVLHLWKQNLSEVSETAAQALADPRDYPDEFPNLEEAQKAERWLQGWVKGETGGARRLLATEWTKVPTFISTDWVKVAQESGLMEAKQDDEKQAIEPAVPGGPQTAEEPQSTAAPESNNNLGGDAEAGDAEAGDSAEAPTAATEPQVAEDNAADTTPQSEQGDAGADAGTPAGAPTEEDTATPAGSDPGAEVAVDGEEERSSTPLATAPTETASEQQPDTPTADTGVDEQGGDGEAKAESEDDAWGDDGAEDGQEEEQTATTPKASTPKMSSFFHGKQQAPLPQDSTQQEQEQPQEEAVEPAAPAEEAAAEDPETPNFSDFDISEDDEFNIDDL